MSIPCDRCGDDQKSMVTLEAHKQAHLEVERKTAKGGSWRTPTANQSFGMPAGYARKGNN